MILRRLQVSYSTLRDAIEARPYAEGDVQLVRGPDGRWRLKPAYAEPHTGHGP